MNQAISIRSFLVIAGLGAILYSCNSTPKTLPPDEYVVWIENPENQLKKEKKIGDFSYRLFFKPSDYIALREAVNSNRIDDINSIQARAKELQGFYEFNFDILSADGKISVLKHQASSEAEYGARINYLVSHAQEDFKLVQGKDTFSCISYHFERTYDITPKNTILLGFEKPKNNSSQEDIQLIFTNRLFNTGEIKFQFSKKILKNIPKLSL